jgi:hypothetical protein
MTNEAYSLAKLSFGRTSFFMKFHVFINLKVVKF